MRFSFVVKCIFEHMFCADVVCCSCSEMSIGWFVGCVIGIVHEDGYSQGVSAVGVLGHLVEIVSVGSVKKCRIDV